MPRIPYTLVEEILKFTNKISLYPDEGVRRTYSTASVKMAIVPDYVNNNRNLKGSKQSAEHEITSLLVSIVSD